MESIYKDGGWACREEGNYFEFEVERRKRHGEASAPASSCCEEDHYLVAVRVWFCLFGFFDRSANMTEVGMPAMFARKEQHLAKLTGLARLGCGGSLILLEQIILVYGCCFDLQ